MALALHHFAVHTFFGEIQHFKNVAIFAGLDGGSPFYFAEMIHAKVVSNTHCPGQEFTFFSVSAAAYRVNYPDENILENVFGKELVLYEQKNGSVNFVFVTENEGFKSISISI